MSQTAAASLPALAGPFRSIETLTEEERMALAIPCSNPGRLPVVPLQDPGSKSRPANRKLGHRIWSFSIPTGLTCPGRTPACSTGCYALNYFFRIRWPRLLHLWEWSRREVFVRDVLRQIRRDGIPFVRVHVAGDYDALAYARRWLAIFRAAPATTFFFYTRSWRNDDGAVVPEMVAVLAEMAQLPNVHAWLSEDRDTGPSPAIPGTRVSFTCFNRDDEALVPPHAAIVFRHKRKKLLPAKWIRGIWVCPVEQGRPTRITCSACRYCLSRGAMPRPPGARSEDRP